MKLILPLLIMVSSTAFAGAFSCKVNLSGEYKIEDGSTLVISQAEDQDENIALLITAKNGSLYDLGRPMVFKGDNFWHVVLSENNSRTEEGYTLNKREVMAVCEGATISIYEKRTLSWRSAFAFAEDTDAGAIPSTILGWIVDHVATVNLGTEFKLTLDADKNLIMKVTRSSSAKALGILPVLWDRGNAGTGKYLRQN
jgi:hypothetical protein